ncbi:MAG: hypothetical protein RR705_09545 [Lachnospiraceae bacterium]
MVEKGLGRESDEVIVCDLKVAVLIAEMLPLLSCGIPTDKCLVDSNCYFKCSSELVVLVENGIVTVFESRRDTQETREKFKRRSAAYANEIALMCKSKKAVAGCES